MASTRPWLLGLGQQGLAEDPLQYQGELGPHLRLLVGREDVDDAVDGLDAEFVQGGEGEVSRLGDAQGLTR